MGRYRVLRPFNAGVLLAEGDVVDESEFNYGRITSLVGLRYLEPTGDPVTKWLDPTQVPQGVREAGSTHDSGYEPVAEDEPFDASAWTVSDVLDLVSEGQVTAEAALASELAGKGRKSLIDNLQTLLSTNDSDEADEESAEDGEQ